jgi:hypothetical protein
MNIEIRNGIVKFYGNKAGYIESEKAVCDTMFATPELSGWLSERGYFAEWKDGVYDKLCNRAMSVDAPELKSCRIWQIRSDADSLMKFISYDEMLKNYGEPAPENYETVFDGNIETNNLDKIFEIFNIRQPPGFTGHALSMSDVVELYDDNGSEFHYVDRFGFTPIDFSNSEQTQNISM